MNNSQEKKLKRSQNKGGRPTKLTQDTIGKLEAAFAVDATVEEACFYAGINPDTYYSWVKKNTRLSERFKALRNKPILLARQTIVSKIPESYQNAMDYLKRKRRAEFGDSQDITSGQKPIQVNSIKFVNFKQDDGNDKQETAI